MTWLASPIEDRASYGRDRESINRNEVLRRHPERFVDLADNWSVIRALETLDLHTVPSRPPKSVKHRRCIARYCAPVASSENLQPQPLMPRVGKALDHIETAAHSPDPARLLPPTKLILCAPEFDDLGYRERTRLPVREPYEFRVKPVVQHGHPL